jgi:hypothetical protein
MDDYQIDPHQEDVASDSCGITKNEVIKLLYNQDQSVALVAPEKFKSPIWERFRVVYYKGERRTDKVSRSVIRECDVIAAFCSRLDHFLFALFFHSLFHSHTSPPLTYFFLFSILHANNNENKGVKLNFVQCIGCSLVLVYKSRTGTASLLRHRCARFPISVYDLKLAAAGHHIELLTEMASSSNNGTIELKQEMLSDEEDLMQEIDDEQQFTTEQTNKGLMESFSLLEKSFLTGEEENDMKLSREEVETAQRNNDPDLFFER